jgi:CBS domain-containing protein
MKASDVMVRSVITVGPDLSVQAIARTLLDNCISAVPVVDRDCQLVGIVSEGDLIRRPEVDTERRRSWWLGALTSVQTLAEEFAKSHGRTASDVMTADVVTATPDTSLREIADLLEKHGIKRVPIVVDGRVVGLVSRANLLQALAASGELIPPTPDEGDEALREEVVNRLTAQPWGNRPISVIVHSGVVDLWGFVDNAEEKKAVRVLAEEVPGVRAVNDNLRIDRMVSGT